VKKLHSVSLIGDLCVGCTTCSKGCPTQAIRVRGGKATIYDIRCIDCAQCIRICPYHAKIAVTDTLEERLSAASGKVKVAIVSPAIFSQFENSATRIDVMKCVRQMGFDYVFDESIGYSGYVSAARQMLHEKQSQLEGLSEDEKSEIFPMISTTCPVVVRLIQMKYRALISHLVTLDSPLELTAQYAIDYLCQKLQIKKSLIYLCYISPCPARVTSVINPLWKKKSLISTCVGTHDVYPQLRKLLDKLTDHDHLTHEEERAIRISDPNGLRCAAIGGESTSMMIENYLSVDGIENVIDILEEIDRDNIKKIAYVEATCCFGGCIGGPLTVMNRFAAVAKLREHVHDFYLEKQLFPQLIVHEEDIIPQVWELPLPENHAMRLSENIGEAMTKYEQIDEILATLPQLDCGACGAPSCAAMAEDIVQGRASINNCIIRQKRMKKE